MFAGLFASAYSSRVEVLSDKELDEICVGGFDFNLNAAYAFRSAVASQSNIAAVATLNSSSAVNINATNQAIIRNQGNSAVASQINISTVLAKIGDITNAIINNLNVADVSNIFTEEGGVKLEAASVSASTPVNESPVNLAALDSVVTPPTDGLATATPQDTSSVELTPPIEAPLNTTPSSPNEINFKLHEITASASAVVAQTNIAAVVAFEGAIDNAKINNLNLANVENEGSAALAAQTNIAMVIAANDIVNTDIANANFAKVVNVNTTATGGASVVPLSTNIPVDGIHNNRILVINNAQASQRNIVFVKSFANNIRNRVINELNLKRVMDFR